MKLLDYQNKIVQQTYKTTDHIADLNHLLHINHNLHLRLNHYIEHRGSIPIQPVINWNKKLADFLEERKFENVIIE